MHGFCNQNLQNMASSENKQAASLSHSGDGPEIINNLGSSFRSDGFGRMSSDEFDRESDDNANNLLHTLADKG